MKRPVRAVKIKKSIFPSSSEWKKYYDEGEYFYHGTSSDNLKDIKEKGLRKGIREGIFFCANPEGASYWAHWRQGAFGERRKPVLLRINQEFAYDKYEFDYDQSGSITSGYTCVVSYKNIEAKDLEILTTQGWKRLK